jgi:hypothetical protein
MDGEAQMIWHTDSWLPYAVYVIVLAVLLVRFGYLLGKRHYTIGRERLSEYEIGGDDE